MKTITLTEAVDPLYLQVDATSNPASNFTFYFNNTIISAVDHVTSTFLNSTSESAVVQTGILSDAVAGNSNGGMYKIETCNVVGCKKDEWKVVINCMYIVSYIFVYILCGDN